MTEKLYVHLDSALSTVCRERPWGCVQSIEAGLIRVSGLSHVARLGDVVQFDTQTASGEIIAVQEDSALVMPNGDFDDVGIADRVRLEPQASIYPCNEWLGQVLDAYGNRLDGVPLAQGDAPRPLSGSLPPAGTRRGLGGRLDTGLAVLDTLLPICRGQRIGLFAGSGVGKSMLLADLARNVTADVVVVALIGERSREVREFVEQTLGADRRQRTVVIASTCDQPATFKRRGAQLALSVAEHFRDEGQHVLLLFDSISRFADAHREIALSGGETPSLRAYPPSTFRTIAALAERAGPGAGTGGDITAIFSVLVAGSDMEEPIADTVRGILDGHIVLDRTIAERGRFPAIDVRRSVSRSLPGAASGDEIGLLREAREVFAIYEEVALMVQSGLYATGADPRIDRAVRLWPALDSFAAATGANCADSYRQLATIMSADPEAAGGEKRAR